MTTKNDEMVEVDPTINEAPFSDEDVRPALLLQPLVRAVEEACSFAETIRSSGQSSGTDNSRSRNFTTGADLAVEMLLGTSLRALDPSAGFISEDKPLESENGCWWIVDPIDGTGNYMSGLPFATSVAYMDDTGEVIAGVVCCPAEKTTHYALKEGGAFKRVYQSDMPEIVRPEADTKKSKTSKSAAPKKKKKQNLEAPCGGVHLQIMDYETLEQLANRYHNDTRGVGNLLFGMPQTPAKTPRMLGNIAALSGLFGDLKRIGPTSLDICKVASGEALCYVGIEPELWDVAAACLILQEAGGRLAGGYKPGLTNSDIYLAGSSGICELCCELLGMSLDEENEADKENLP